jgi:pyruvate/2-oxoglutarate dehydrogenase complex dihydrolipoamide dehydrogenase (E3) component
MDAEAVKGLTAQIPVGRRGYPEEIAEAFDAIIIGAGQAGPPLAGRLTAAGMKVGADRAQAVRRHLRQHRLHADQDAGRQRLCRASGAPRGAEYGVTHRRRGRRRHEAVKARKDAGRRAIARRRRILARRAWSCTVYRATRASNLAAHRCRSATSLHRGEAIFINVGGRAVVPDLPGVDRSPR